MMTEYDLSLVVASYVVAVFASYTALYFGARLADGDGRHHVRWLVVGALAMGTGIWTMHFVGMSAMTMQVEMSFSAFWTLVSWLAAVVAAGIALNMIGRKQLGIGTLLGASVMMGGGIVAMHYVGMYAMKMSAPPTIDGFFLAISVVIALTASGLALAICRQVRQVAGFKAIVMQLSAALVMALAICGMHYTGMSALMYPEGAVPDANNTLSGDWMGVPLALLCSALLLVAISVTALDLKSLKAEREEAELLDQRARQMAFVDAVTGLPNRSGLERELLEALARSNAALHPFAVMYFDLGNFRELSNELDADALNALIFEAGNELKERLDGGTFIARYSNSAFAIVVHHPENEQHAVMYKRLRSLPELIGSGSNSINWRVGQAVFPTTGTSSRKLIRAAMITMDTSQLGRFDDLEADSNLVLPGQTVKS